MLLHKVGDEVYTVKEDQGLNKVYNSDGKVAVLYSVGFGAGWYSWNTEHPQCLFSPAHVFFLLGDGEEPDSKELFSEDFYDGGKRDLTIHWMQPGQMFRINEYDGMEDIEYLSDANYMEA